jgi:hypothetical protein
MSAWQQVVGDEGLGILPELWRTLRLRRYSAVTVLSLAPDAESQAQARRSRRIPLAPWCLPDIQLRW